MGRNDNLSDLNRLQLVLDILPADDIIGVLGAMRGKAGMAAWVGLAVTVMMALAVGHIKAGRPEKMRLLVWGCYAWVG